MIEIRDASGDDWPAIFPIFTEIVDAGETYAYPEGLESAAARALWMQPLPARTVVAVDSDRVLGSATTGPNRAGRGSHVATASFMVDGAARGRGVGRALGSWVVETARAGASAG